jgi:hypothetical protein
VSQYALPLTIKPAAYLATSYIGDTNVIRLLASPFSGTLHWALHRQCEKPTYSHITCLPQFHSVPCRSSSSLQLSDRSEPQSSCWGRTLWRPGNFNPIHILTSPVGQPLASRTGGQGYTSWGCTHTVLLLVMPATC